MIDWTKPIRWKEHHEIKLHFVGFNREGNAIVDAGGGRCAIDNLVVRKIDGTGFYIGDLTIENIPKKVERWVVGDPNSNSVVWWYPSEAKALENICYRYCKPTRIEVEI